MDQATRLLLETELSLLDAEQLAAIAARYEWLGTARPDQLPPADFFVWLLRGGRGSGKTRAGSEEMWWPGYIEDQRIAVIAPTNNDVRKTCFEGESGLIARIPKSLIINYNRTSLELRTRTLGGGESYYVGYSAEEPERLRGPQHHRAWCEELGAWKTATAEDTWDMLMFGLRLGNHPSVIVTTTPRANPLFKKIIADSATVTSSASTFDNVDNLPASTLKKLREKYEGTRLGRQELYAELVEEIMGALWSPDSIIHLDLGEEPPELTRVVVAVDPSGAGSQEEGGDEIGIVVAGLGSDNRFYVLADRTVLGGPDEWAKAAIKAYEDFDADRIVAESNFGGAMVEATIRTHSKDVSYRAVRASRGKVVRAEPVSALYEQGKVTHVRGLIDLESQMLSMTTGGYVGSGSPDRVDALVWAITDLMKGRRAIPTLDVSGDKQENWAKVS